MAKEMREMKILFFPWLAYGHVSPYFELASRLSTKHSIKTYLCSTQVNLTAIQNRRNSTAVELIPLQ
ncbi:glycosyltransferase, partial [Genlisea aurea]